MAARIPNAIPLNRAALGLLEAPAQRPQDVADMADMKAGTKGLLDDLGDAETNPEISGVACRPAARRSVTSRCFFGSGVSLGGHHDKGLVRIA
jgi:hypothetical protein